MIALEDLWLDGQLETNEEWCSSGVGIVTGPI